MTEPDEILYDDGFDSEEGDSRPQRPTIAETISALKAGIEPAAATVAYGLSNLDDAEMTLVRDAWRSLDEDYRLRILQALLDVNEQDIDTDYTALAALGLSDDVGEVRAAAVELLWEDESPELLDHLIAMSTEDESDTARAAALSGLGRFILLGELGEFPEEPAAIALETAIAVYEDRAQSVEVRRRALEALSNSSHPMLPAAIAEAYQDHDQRMQASAIFAMGRSYDDQWASTVLTELDSEDHELRYEAARAAGELELEDAVPALSRAAFEADVEIRDAAIWSLGEIASKEAVRVLRLLADDARTARNEELRTVVEDALASAELNGGDLYLFRLDE